MNDNFWRVSFIGTSNDYFFHNYEDAAAFLLESYFDECELEDENTVIDINNQVAEENGIDGYGYIDEMWFEK